MKHLRYKNLDLEKQKIELEKFLRYIEYKIESRNERIVNKYINIPYTLDNSLEIKYKNTKEKLRQINLQIKRGK